MISYSEVACNHRLVPTIASLREDSWKEGSQNYVFHTGHNYEYWTSTISSNLYVILFNTNLMMAMSHSVGNTLNVPLL